MDPDTAALLDVVYGFDFDDERPEMRALWPVVGEVMLVATEVAEGWRSRAELDAVVREARPKLMDLARA